MPKLKSLYHLIRNDIEEKIRKGVYKSGQKIPFEHELMAQYGCSRMTVSKALGALSEMGLIERRRRAGSFVRLPRLNSTVLDIPDIQTQIEARGEAYRFVCLSQTIRDAHDENERELTGGGPVLHIRGVHYINDRPLAYEDRLINIDAVKGAKDIDFMGHSPGHWLLQAVAWTRSETQISAINADMHTAKHLSVRLNTACLVILRKTWHEALRITTVKQVFDSAAYQLSASLQRP